MWCHQYSEMLNLRVPELSAVFGYWTSLIRLLLEVFRSIAAFVFIVEHFEFWSFHTTGHQDGRQNVACMFEKKKILISDFEQSEQSSFCVKCLCKYKRTNRLISIAEVNSRCFYWLSAAIVVPLSGTQMWHFHAELYKFVWNILTDNLIEYRISHRPETWQRRY